MEEELKTLRNNMQEKERKIVDMYKEQERVQGQHRLQLVTAKKEIDSLQTGKSE